MSDNSRAETINFFDDPVRLKATLRKLFHNTGPTILSHLIEVIGPEWNKDEEIRASILGELENLFAFGYDDTHSVNCLHYLLPLFEPVFSCEKMLAQINAGYVLNCLSRG